MWWLLLSLSWWCGTSAVPAPGPDAWVCPEIAEQPVVECSCDMPHTLRCAGDSSAMEIIGKKLRSMPSASVSLLDCTVQNVSSLPGLLLEGVALHGLVVSSGEIREIHGSAFEGLAAPLQALGLPNNQLSVVPTSALEKLPELDRLDLSGNKMKSLDAESFKGLRNLSFIELSHNAIAKISPDTFEDLPQLKILRLSGNRLATPTISKLDRLPAIEELDLSENALVGPLGPTTFPKMPALRDLQLSHNSFSSVKMGALAAVEGLAALSLHHNQIDVLEDNAFVNLRSLVSLDLSHNRIVAVSGASLAHLVSLVDLDLRHNFLRALTADLVLPLQSLQNLRLDDNDISIVSSDALKNTTILKRLTLSENPLNCDCSLTEFALWLSNSTLTLEDKSSPVCTTPPSLENGLLVNVSVEDLLCGEEERDNAAPIKSQVDLHSFNYDGSRVTLEWKVDESAAPYSCDAIFVYEEEGPSEVLLESNPLKCNSSSVPDPRMLTVDVPNSTRLVPGRRYRYCVVLLESEQDNDDLSLVLGCSDVMPLVRNVRVLPRTDPIARLPRVVSIRANLSDYGGLTIAVDVRPSTVCEVNVAILEHGSLLSQKRVNCTEPKYTHAGLHDGSYRVCANVILPNRTTESGLKPRCVTVYKKVEAEEEKRRLSGLDVAFVSIFLILSFAVIALVWGVRRVLLRPKLTPHQCFMPPELDDEHQHSRYVKLQATTKL